MVRTAPHPVKNARNIANNPKATTPHPITKKKNGELSRSGSGLKVNWPRPRLEIHLRYVGSPEETRWRCEIAGTKSLVRFLPKLCSASGGEEV